MNKQTIAAVALSVAATATLAGCGSNTASSTSSTATPMPSMSGTPMAGMSGTPMAGMSSTPSAGMASTPAASAPATTSSGSAKLLGIATKLGCVKPRFEPANANGRANGGLGMITCDMGKRQALLIQMRSANDRDRLAKTLMKRLGKSTPYLRGDDWFAVISAADGKSEATKAELGPFAEKTGATIGMLG